MPMIEGKVYSLASENADELFRTIFPDLEPDAKYILISKEGMMTFTENPSVGPGPLGFPVPHFTIMSYYDIQFESE